MARKRPGLVGWDDARLRRVTATDPEAWVGTILNTFSREAIDRADQRFNRVWRYGEIREAIRRELIRRGTSDVKAFQSASLRAWRGLHSLEGRGALRRTKAGYSLKERWGWAEMISDVAHELAGSRAKLSSEIIHGIPSGHTLRLSFESKFGRSVVLLLPIEG